MKRNIIYCLVALFLLMSFFMPDVALGIYENRLEAGTVSFRNDDISISIDRDYNLFNLMYLFEECDVQLELSEGRRMTESTAADICVELRNIFASDESKDQRPQSVKPYLLSRGDDMATASIYWMAFWEDGSVIWIDDEGGNLIACEGRLIERLEDGAMLARPLKRVAALISEYYLKSGVIKNASIAGEENEYLISLYGGEEEGGCSMRLFRQSSSMFYVIPHRGVYVYEVP